MTQKLSDLWIFSDIDGTIVEAPNPIPSRNLEALRRFIGEGGHFAVATGRSVDSALQYVPQLPVNVPCITFNGAAIYDFSKKELVAAHYLPESWREYIAVIRERFPQAGVTLLSDRLYASVGEKPYVQTYLVDADHVVPQYLRMEDVSEPCIKAIIVLLEEDVPKLQAFLDECDWKDVSVLRSSPNFVELLPNGTDKGTGLREYARLMGIPIENTIAIGDYYNDEAMLRAAGLSVTVEGAPEEVKYLCRHVTGPCMGGALADLVEFLEARCK